VIDGVIEQVKKGAPSGREDLWVGVNP